MKIFVRAISAIACVLAISAPSQAGLFFNELVDLQLSNAGAVANVLNVGELDFLGVLAINGSDTDGTPGFSVGDTNRVIGFSNNDGFKIGNPFTSATTAGSAAGSGAEITAVIRNWNGTVTDITPLTSTTRIEITYDSNVNDGAVASMPVGTGLVDLYLDTGKDFSSTDAEKSSNGIWLATFGLIPVQSLTSSPAPRTVFESTTGGNPLAGAGFTRTGLVLLAQIGGGTATTADDIFVASGDPSVSLLGPNLFLASFIASTESPIPDPPFTNIFGGASDPVDVGSDYAPPSIGGSGILANNFPFDIASTFDSANTFALIPEPSSFLLASLGFAVFGAYGGLRRRKNKKAEQDVA